MFIDGLAVMLVNMAAGLVVLAGYAVLGRGGDQGKAWAPAFAATGLLALFTGLYTVFAWPLPGSYNIAFGEPYTLFGVLFLAAAWTLAAGWDLLPLTIYSVLAGIASIVVGLRVASLGLTKEPALTATGYVLTGLAAILTLPALGLPAGRRLAKPLALVALAAAMVWAVVAYPAFWEHLSGFSKWVPVVMRSTTGAK